MAKLRPRQSTEKERIEASKKGYVRDPFVTPDNSARFNQISRKNDEVRDYSVTLKDIDTALINHIKNTIDPQVVQNNTVLKVPVIYDSPEIFKGVQSDGYYRDKNGKLQYPIIGIQRISVQKDRTIGNKLDANNVNNYQVVSVSNSKDNVYDRFSVLNNRKAKKEIYAVAVADYVTIDYSCVIQTNYLSHLNTLIESFNYASDSFWGDPNHFSFRCYIDSYGIANEVSTGEDRAVVSNFNIKLHGYIVPSTFNSDLTKVKKYYSKTKIKFDVESSDNSDDFANT